MNKKRFAKELIVGAIVVFAAVLILIRSGYKEYMDKMTIVAENIQAKGNIEKILKGVKGTWEISDAKTEEILEEYGYDKIRASRYGKEFCAKSVMMAVGGAVLYVGYVCVLFYERKKTEKEQKEEWMKLVGNLERIRGGDYSPDYYEDYTEKNEYSDLVLNQLDSLCGYLDFVTKEARRDKEETKALVTDISHQLKTPVAALNSCFEILQKESLTQEEKKEFETRLAHQLKGLEQLVKTLVNVSRLETGMVEIHLKKNRIFNTILEAVNRVWEKAEEKEIEIELDGEENVEEMEILHDRKWLCEALLNVLENAVKYSPKGTKITIRTKTGVSFLRIEVEDEGIGVPKSEYHKIFQRFYRGEAEEVQCEEGQGIGLYLVRQIINEHHGMVFVQPAKQKNGKGSVFVIQLPHRKK